MIGWQSGLRRVVDVIIASLALCVLAPLMACVAVAIKISSPGPVLFRQQRAGINRELFWLLKFRTMRIGSDEAMLRDQVCREMLGEDMSSGGSWKLDDNRITPVGSLLRRWSLDEVPQLLNVLQGHMNLVGPRPCLAWEAELFTPEFGERFTVRPGLTGLWQVSGRSTVGTREMLALDIQYVQHRTLLADIAILAKTPQAVLRVDGAR
ncbi:MAG: sugar transferase [Mycobacterium sp.]